MIEFAVGVGLTLLFDVFAAVIMRISIAHWTASSSDIELDQQTLDRLFPAHQMVHEGDSCAICLAVISEHEYARSLKCEHTFHRECIDGWLLSRSARPHCPLCREVLSMS
mmetsp:Transcript_107090/g.341779  ORF Transcript_107090/g.341779 Transcript_107090/m.341779 type:complete len:110 (+) Transcript_107090:128-457(+)